MKIRFAREEDAAELLAIYRPFVAESACSFEYDVPTVEEFARRIRKIGAFYPYLVAEEDGKILGYAYAGRSFEREAYRWIAEYSIYLAESARGRGLGRRMYGCLNAICHAQGVSEAYAKITSENTASIAFHEAVGFKTIAVIPRCGYKLEQWWDVAWMTRPLHAYAGEPYPLISLHALDKIWVEQVLRSFEGNGSLPTGFAYLDEAVQGVEWEAKYAEYDNFTGRPVAGYCVDRIAGSVELLAGLCRARDIAAQEGLRLLVWDAYRPCRAVADFVRWAKEPEDGRTKAAHYPNLDKGELFEKGYIAEKSSHSRGAAVDLTLVDAQGSPLDMGGGFDLMDEISHHGWPGATEEQKKNRARLMSIMQRAGFEAYESEWWHYLLKAEPYPEQYFDFVIG